MKKLTVEHLAAYLPYGVSVKPSMAYSKKTRYYAIGLMIKRNVNHYSLLLSDTPNGEFICDAAPFEIKPLLRPLSQLTEVIEHGGERFVPIEYFEIGDGHNDSIEYGYGNIKLINTLKSISDHEVWQDCDFLPNGVVRHLHSLHFDTFGLIESGLAEPIPSIKQP